MPIACQTRVVAGGEALSPARLDPSGKGVTSRALSTRSLRFAHGSARRDGKRGCTWPRGLWRAQRGSKVRPRTRNEVMWEALSSHSLIPESQHVTLRGSERPLPSPDGPMMTPRPHAARRRPRRRRRSSELLHVSEPDLQEHSCTWHHPAHTALDTAPPSARSRCHLPNAALIPERCLALYREQGPL